MLIYLKKLQLKKNASVLLSHASKYIWEICTVRLTEILTYIVLVAFIAFTTVLIMITSKLSHVFESSLKLNFRKYPAIHTNYITSQNTTL